MTKNYADYVGELYATGAVKSYPRKLLRSGQYVTEDKNGLSSVNVSAEHFVMFPAGRFSDDDNALVEEVKGWVKAQGVEETPAVAEKPKGKAPASTD